MTTAHDIDLPGCACRSTHYHPSPRAAPPPATSAPIMGWAEAYALCGAEYGERSAERTNQRNGYRQRRFDTRTGTLDLPLPSCGTAPHSPGCCWSNVTCEWCQPTVGAPPRLEA